LPLGAANVIIELLLVSPSAPSVSAQLLSSGSNATLAYDPELATSLPASVVSKSDGADTHNAIVKVEGLV